MIFPNIDKFYEENRHQLLESNELRPCKSITRDVDKPIETLREYYLTEKTKRISKEDIKKALNQNDTDTLNTNIRVMREFGFLISEASDTFLFTDKLGQSFFSWD